MVTAEQVNRYQTEGWFHPLTCRQCRGQHGNCRRRNFGVVNGDHHVLDAQQEGEAVVLVCDCCGYRQDLGEQLATIVERVLDGPDPLAPFRVDEKG